MDNMNADRNVANNTKEKCVVCGAETEYLFSTPINERQYYVEGAGQLCPQCHYNLCVKKSR